MSKTIEVLIVDDHDLVRAGMRRMLDDEDDIKVIAEARNGEDAVQLGRKLEPDVIVMDLKMPGIGGFGATHKLLRTHPDIKVLVVTALSSPLYQEHLFQVGAAGYLNKGATSAEMIAAIREVHDGKRYISPDIANVLMDDDENQRQQESLGTTGESPFARLTSRQQQVVLLTTTGANQQDIANALSLSVKTVSMEREAIFKQLMIHDDMALALLAICHGLVKPKDIGI